MKKNGIFFVIIGFIILSFVAVRASTIQTSANLTNNIKSSSKEIPKKKDLLGTFVVKKDKKSILNLNENGTYNLSIDICNDHLFLSGYYELRDSKLILKNTSTFHEDLKGNEELSFTIIDKNTIKVDESLICTLQGTLFEK